jgi:hypothetical protein
MVLVALALVLGGLVAACGDDGGEEADSATSSTSIESSTTSTTADPEAAERQTVIDAYLAADEAAVAASAPPAPNPDDPDLLATHTGPMLEQRQEVFLGLRANGWAIRYPENSRYRVEVESVRFERADVAILDICAVDDGERVVVETGEVLSSGVGTVQATAAMQRVDGVWKLAERREENRWEGEAGCAAD